MFHISRDLLGKAKSYDTIIFFATVGFITMRKNLNLIKQIYLINLITIYNNYYLLEYNYICEQILGYYISMQVFM